jgi:hypothetical protein
LLIGKYFKYFFQVFIQKPFKLVTCYILSFQVDLIYSILVFLLVWFSVFLKDCFFQDSSAQDYLGRKIAVPNTGSFPVRSFSCSVRLDLWPRLVVVLAFLYKIDKIVIISIQTSILYFINTNINTRIPFIDYLLYCFSSDKKSWFLISNSVLLLSWRDQFFSNLWLALSILETFYLVFSYFVDLINCFNFPFI